MDPREVTIAALLHDIGKVMYRGIEEAQRERVCHQELGYLWAGRSGLPEPVREAIRRHHDVRRGHARYDDLSPRAYKGPTETRNLLYLVGEADNIAAGMERDRFDEGAFDLSAPLANIFADIQLDGRPEAPRTSWPLHRGEDPAHDVRLTTTEREALWRELEADLAKAGPRPNPSSLTYVLQKHLSQFPEHSWVGAESPATSLYSHLKSTAAVALALYRYLDESGTDWAQDQSARIRERGEERFALVSVDLSGVQRFVYRVPSRRALRLLRARSFFLELLCESVADGMLQAAGLERPNIVFIGGGRFVVLGPNTQGALGKMQAVVDYVNDWLLSRFGPALYVAMAHVPASAELLRGDVADAWDRLQVKTGESKATRWQRRLETLFTPTPVKRFECDGCRAETDSVVETEDGELRLCPFCASMLQLGAALPGMTELWKTSKDEAVTLTLPGASYREHGPGTAVYLLSDVWRDLPDTYLKQDLRLLPTAGLVTDKEMSSLAEDALGAPRVGVLRMDVDNLGAVFSRGLARRTFARISDLSERLNMYFRYMLPQRISSVLARESVLGPVERDLAVNVVYAGGDDLFVVGSWDQMLDLAFFVAQDFRRFTGGNPSLTISGGLAVLDFRTAIQKSAGIAGGEEARAKLLGRDRLVVWGRNVQWTDRQSVASVLAALREQRAARTYRLGLSRSLLYSLRLLLDSGDELLLPKVYYLLRAADARRLLDPVVRGLREDWLAVALEIADLACRGGVHE